MKTVDNLFLRNTYLNDLPEILYDNLIITYIKLRIYGLLKISTNSKLAMSIIAFNTQFHGVSFT